MFRPAPAFFGEHNCAIGGRRFANIPRRCVASELYNGSIVQQMKREGGFTLPGFGTFRVAKTKARKARNPRTGEPIKVKAGKTVRFKASPTLKKSL